MAKRPDKNDATMEVSASQLVPGKPKRPPPRPPVGPQNDMSMWAGAVVGGDQFTPAPIPPKASGGSGRWILAIVVLLALAGGGYALYRFVLVDSAAPKPMQAVDNPIDAMPLIADAPIVIDALVLDAAVVVDAAAPDAAIEPTIAPKPAVKAPVKKKVVKKKKKPVKKPVRRRR
ncbi:MAG TPA: hypothetical protein VIU61_07695 [Kofleriaceae bacterium]